MYTDCFLHSSDNFLKNTLKIFFQKTAKNMDLWHNKGPEVALHAIYM